ncbi:hypothetical protein AC578_8342 [Pseudocercospora eumusae]|uniref:Uncharacterized protein n=1 Tax=Pseudocercospora eumusae TaxID=321146 RepID=A0A139HRR6_9PEZI|nr:hypothetical protein AC578_8342 [Pseudocercospora eumusae]
MTSPAATVDNIRPYRCIELRESCRKDLQRRLRLRFQKLVAREVPLRNVLVLRDVVLLIPPKAEGGVVAVVEVPGIAIDELESSSS